MIPGIDPKIDIAFRKVFGSEPWRDLTVALINAVLEAPPPHRVVDVLLTIPPTLWLSSGRNGASRGRQRKVLLRDVNSLEMTSDAAQGALAQCHVL